MLDAREKELAHTRVELKETSQHAQGLRQELFARNHDFGALHNTFIETSEQLAKLKAEVTNFIHLCVCSNCANGSLSGG
jgi:hypothetical protein